MNCQHNSNLVQLIKAFNNKKKRYMIMQIAQRMNRLGTENAFEVLAEVKKLQAQGKALLVLL
jgi:hypothetical protein